ncbi:response regulator [Actinoplanes sp. NPDC023714]|uniref:response regulator n=1 Tax=Actinoplanes sp. NPDC023714 TaxID=3154322 RepID=UPI0033F5B8D3
MAGGIELLLIQDDPADVLLMSDDFLTNKLTNRVQIASNAAIALAYLAGTTPFTRPGRPDLVLLDLNLPGRDGRVVLRRIRADPATASVPVVLLVDSPAAEEILRAELLPVQGYVVKPVDFDRLVAVVRSLNDLGFQILRHDGASPIGDVR